MKLKNLLIAGASCVLTAAIAVGGTLAYLQDDDSDVNVMTTGKVSIVQNEQQRVDPSKNGTLTDTDIEDFKQAKPIYPYVDVNLDGAMKNDYEEITFPDGNTYKLFVGDNAIDKLVSVTNNGKSDAYVRTIVALEAPTDKIDLAVSSKKGWAIDTVASSNSIEVDGVKYDLFVCVYKNVLKPGETTPYSLMQIILDRTATNEDAAAYGNTYDVLVLSQAVQAEGFADAQTALDTAFGKITTTNHPWMSGVDIPTVASTQDEVQNAVFADATTIILADDVAIKDSEAITFSAGETITLDLNGHKLTGPGYIMPGFNGTVNIIGSKADVTCGILDIFGTVNFIE
ncbi:MAG: hypothetical protein IJ370_07730 [Oscillospiraceae bacterium]|nr:hypothetical protein [Oscillospiraceae bacterium]